MCNPYVVRAKSGLGKSILLGKAVAELINVRHNVENSVWPRFEKIIFSQLKDSVLWMDKDLETAICEGLDEAHKCENFESETFERENENPHIVIIDSLDEHLRENNGGKLVKNYSKRMVSIVGLQRP